MPDNEDALSTTLVAEGGEEAKVTSDFSKIEPHRMTLIVIITSAVVAL
jgi:hypothetical protein